MQRLTVVRLMPPQFDFPVDLTLRLVSSPFDFVARCPPTPHVSPPFFSFGVSPRVTPFHSLYAYFAPPLAGLVFSVVGLVVDGRLDIFSPAT